MDEKDTRLIPGTKREGRAKEKAAWKDSRRAGDRETARKMREKDRKLKGRERKRDRTKKGRERQGVRKDQAS